MMTTNIPQHVRHNYEATDHLLFQTRAMLRAVEAMAEAANLPNSPEIESLFVLITATQSKLIEAEKAHGLEWVGHGGESTSVTPEEIAAARGEAGEAAQ
ncbi:hypothetical protein M8756_00090 [Lutimaribacter sp. EGI FJ00015]|uniref:Uncharacterized protein n=1 Tax=Lutimaribacter degradans TaxID=2945989 RepID=A0ACC5ZSS7_9RHOB|nr:hypothetical protein [Lutimaribacter sp. EGI FJ00013]MCM2561356.1 hypothetical protein [Lutimaribacter sp. EGI FJ00013]MCO0611693.1 hypothetical protein [Lutimaribacter sp. EGI FJ00015]MCO0635185.1 hypothetical protein [Lutimaribacter sp. EGI FJ00014]